MNNHDQLVKRIQEQINSELKTLLKDNLFGNILSTNDVLSFTESYLYKIAGVDSINVDIEVTQNGDIFTLTGKNLYSFLLLSGKNVPYFLLDNIKDEYSCDEGTYKYKFENGKHLNLFLPSKPIEYIECKIEIGGE